MVLNWTSYRHTTPISFAVVIAIFSSITILTFAASVRSSGPTECPTDGGDGTHGVQVYVFYSSACPSCEVARSLIMRLTRVRPGVSIQEFDVLLSDNQALHRAFSIAAGVPRGRRDKVPMIFTGSRYLLWEDLTLENLVQAVDECHGEEGSPEVTSRDVEVARLNLEAEFGALNVLVVVAAGFTDGINPCAFAILVFLVS